MLPFFLFFGMFWNVLEWWLNPSNVPMKAPASEGPYSHKRTIHLTENVPISSVLRLCAGVILQASELQDFFHRILKWRLVTGIRRIWYDTHDGSMVLLYIYGNMDPINIPQSCWHIYQHHGSVMWYDMIWYGIYWSLFFWGDQPEQHISCIPFSPFCDYKKGHSPNQNQL